MQATKETKQKAINLLLQEQYSEAISLLEARCEPIPEDISDLWYLGIALLLNGDEELAQFTWLSVISSAENSEELVENLVRTLDQFSASLLRYQKTTTAQKLYQVTLEIDASFADAYFGLGLCHFQTENYQEAIPYFQEFLNRDQEYEDAYYKLANCFEATDNVDAAVVLLEKAIEVNPDFNRAYIKLNNLLCQKFRTAQEEHKSLIKRMLLHFADKTLEDNRRDLAEHCFKNIVELFPEDSYAHSRLAIAYKNADHTSLVSPEVIIGHFKRAIELNPNCIDYYYTFALYLETLERFDEALELIQQGQVIEPDNIACKFALGKLKLSLKQKNEAKQIFEEIWTGYSSKNIEDFSPNAVINLSLVNTELGHLYEKARNSQKAFSHFQKANQLQLKITKEQILKQEQRQKKDISQAIDLFENKQISHNFFNSPSLVNDQQFPAFLLGFARSGTTLIGRILDSHSAIDVAVEKPSLDIAIQKTKLIHLESLLAQPTYLKAIPDQLIQETRKQYFESISSYIDFDPNNLLVDENPFHTITAWITHKIYPESPFVFALRHPCDVVLSCFMQNFVLNACTASFLSLEKTVNFYTQTMRLWNLQNSALNLRVHTIRYESLVEDFETEVRQLLDYLGLPWEDTVTQFYKNSNQGKVKTASYRQVREPIYTQAKYRWQRYREYLEPYLDDLMPFIEQWGYEV